MIISWVDCQETSAKQRQFERQALAAREWFKQHGPPGAPVFPIGYAEREELKMGGLPHIIAWYARSLAARKYNFEEHPSFDEYASGVMASEVPQRSRTAGVFRRLSRVMTELGWTAVRVRDLTRGGYREQVRGYVRDTRNRQLTRSS